VLVYSLAAAIGIVLLLQVVFSSWRLAILSFVTLPSALVGGILRQRPDVRAGIAKQPPVRK